mgnify:CR=1 FL=1
MQLCNKQITRQNRNKLLKWKTTVFQRINIQKQKELNNVWILNVLNFCKENNIQTLALSGLQKDNKSIVLADHSIYVPMKTYGMVECIHQIFLHLLLDEYMEIFEWNREEFQNMNSTNGTWLISNSGNTDEIIYILK